MEDVKSMQTVLRKEKKHSFEKQIRHSSNLNGLMLLGMSIFTYVFSGILIYLLRLWGKEVLSESLYLSLSQLIGYFSRYIIVIPLIVYWNQKKRKKDVPAINFSKPKVSKAFIGKWVLIGIGVVYGVNVIFSILFTIIQVIFKIELSAPSMILGSSLLDNIVTVIFFAFAAPIMEETFFRGVLINNVSRFGSWFAIIMVAVMFGLAHMNYQQIFYAAALGAVSGYICIRSKSLIPSIIIHFSINAVGTIQSVLLSHLNIDKFISGNFDYAYILDNIVLSVGVIIITFLYFNAAIIGIVLFITEIVNHRKEFQLNNSCPILTFKRKAFVFLTAPATLIFILFAVTETILRAMNTSLVIIIRDAFL